jgi:hypothetical protein
MYENVKKELRALAEKARNNGHWFCSAHSGEWLTPEEFENLGLAILITHGEQDRTMVTSYYMRDPKDGIRDRMKRVNKSNADLEQFTERVMTYFILQPKDNH